MANEVVKNIYNLLKQNGSTNAKDVNEFSQRMAGNGYRMQIYSYLKRNGAEGLGSGYGEFSKLTGYGQKSQPTKAASTKQASAVGQQAFGGNSATTPQWQQSSGANAQKTQASKTQPSRTQSNTAESGQQDYQVPKEPMIYRQEPTKMKTAAEMHAERTKEINTALDEADVTKKTREDKVPYKPAMTRLEQSNKATASARADVGKDKELQSEIQGLVNDAIKQGDVDFNKEAMNQIAFQNQYGLGGLGSVASAEKAANLVRDPDKLTENIQKNMQSQLNGYLQKHSGEIAEKAAGLEMSVDDYVNNYVAPQIKENVASTMRETQIAKFMPKDDLEYVLSGINSWLPFAAARAAVETPAQYSAKEEATQRYGQQVEKRLDNETGVLNTIKNAATLYGRTGVEFGDPTFSPIFKGGTMAGKAIAKGIGLTALVDKGVSALFSKSAQYAAKFGSKAGSMMDGLLAKGTAKGFGKQYVASLPGEALGQTIGMNAYGAAQQGISTLGSTGDLEQAGEVAADALFDKHGATSATAFAVFMPFIHGGWNALGLGARKGASALNRAKWVGAKAAYDVAGIGATAGVMQTANAVNDWIDGKGFKMTLNGYIHEAAVAAAMKFNPTALTHIGEIVHYGRGSELFSKSTKAEICKTLGTDNFEDAMLQIFPDMSKSGGKASAEEVGQAQTKYLELMNNLSWDAQNELNAGLTGSLTIQRPRTANYAFRGDDILEYDKDGNLLSTTTLKSADEKKAYITQKKMQQNNADIFDVYGTALDKDETKGKQGVLGTIDEATKGIGATRDDYFAALNKDAMRRSQRDNDILNEVTKSLKDIAYPKDEVHVEQSEIDGGNVIKGSDILGENPNTEAVQQLSSEIDASQQELAEALKNSKENTWAGRYTELKNEGKSDDEIYEILVNDDGEGNFWTVQELAPLVHAIDGQHKQKGAFDAVQNQIDEKVSEEVNDATKGNVTINGEPRKEGDVVSLIDGDGNKVTLLNGDITVSEDGKVSASGDIIVKGADGENHTMRATDMLTIDPEGAKTADELAQKKQDELGTKATGVIDPEEKLNPENGNGNGNGNEGTEALPQQTRQEGETKGEGAPAEQGANGTEGERVEEAPVAEGEVAPAVEETAPVETAPVEETPVEEVEAPKTTESGIPLGEDGEPVYTADGVTAEKAVDEIYNKSGIDKDTADGFVNEMVDKSKKAYEKAQKKEIKRKSGEGLAAFGRRKAENDAAVEALKKESERWQAIYDEVHKNDISEMSDAEMEQIMQNFEEDPYVIIARNMPKITPESYYKETGFGHKDKGDPFFVASESKGGKSVDGAVLHVRDLLEGYNISEYDIRNTIIDIISHGGPRSYLKKLAEDYRDQVRAGYEAEEARQRDEYLDELDAQKEDLYNRNKGTDNEDFYRSRAEQMEADDEKKGEVAEQPRTEQNESVPLEIDKETVNDRLKYLGQESSWDYLTDNIRNDKGVDYITGSDMVVLEGVVKVMLDTGMLKGRFEDYVENSTGYHTGRMKLETWNDIEKILRRLHVRNPKQLSEYIKETYLAEQKPLSKEADEAMSVGEEEFGKGEEPKEEPNTTLGEVVDPKRKGHKQINRAAKELQEALDEYQNNPSEKGAKKVLDAVQNFRLNVARGAEATEAEKAYFDKAEEELKKQGYEIMDLLGKPYNQGMKVIAEIVTDESLEPGQSIITDVKKPSILKDGELIQAGEIVVTQSLYETAEEKQEAEDIEAAKEWLDSRDVNDPILSLTRKFGWDKAKAQRIWRKAYPTNTKEPEGEASGTVADIRKRVPLTEEQIRGFEGMSDDAKDAAIDFLKGEEEPGGMGEIQYTRIANAVGERKEAKPSAPAKQERTEPKVEEPNTATPIEEGPKQVSVEGLFADLNSKGTTKLSDNVIQEDGSLAKDKKKPTREEQKAQDKAAVDKADEELANLLKNFSKDMLDAGKSALGVSLVGLNPKQIEVVGKLSEAIAKSAFARIKMGVHDIEAIVKDIKTKFGGLMKQGGLDDDDIEDLLGDKLRRYKMRDEKGERRSIEEWAKEYGKKAEDAVAQEAEPYTAQKETKAGEFKMSSEMSEDEKPKTKDGWLKAMYPVYEEICKKLGLPAENMVGDVHERLYPRITKGYPLDKFAPTYDGLVKKMRETVAEDATEKQMNFIKRLCEGDEWTVLDGVKLTKHAASYVIDLLKSEQDANHPDEFKATMEELQKVAELNGRPIKETDKLLKDYYAHQEEVKNATETAQRFEEQKVNRDAIGRDLKRMLGKAAVGGEPTIKSINDIRKLAEQYHLEGLSDTDLQEIVESAIVETARGIASMGTIDDAKKFEYIKRLYETQPSLNQRDNDRINLQQYSTPAPMAFVADMFLKGNGKKIESGLEPSAGNGMLTLGLPREKMHVNDIDEMRLSNLQRQGFKEVTNQDGTLPFEPKKYDVVITNPPFGSIEAREHDGYTITGLEHEMAINALDSMKDDGRAAIIIGGNTEYKDNGSIKGAKDKSFLNYLYSHYNVVDVINMDGKKLYSRQGTGYDVRMILIDGRKAADGSFAPVKKNARAEKVSDYDELYNRINDDILRNNNESAGIHNEESGEGNGGNNPANADRPSEEGVRGVRNGGSSEQPELLAANGQRVQHGGQGTTSEGRGDTNGEGIKPVGGQPSQRNGGGTEVTQPSGSTNGASEGGRRGNGLSQRGLDTERHSGVADQSVGAGQRGTESVPRNAEVKRGLGTEKVPYRKQSGNPFTLNSLMPAEQADQVKKTLEKLGDVDEMLVKELGYSSKEDLHHALAAEQVDSVAMAISKMNSGRAFIIGDQTGIGKGRQAAALIRYGVKKGGCPVFVTVKKSLFSDMYRDLCDIGSPELRPFIWAAKDKDHSENVTDADGNVVYKRPSDKEQKRVVDYINKNGKLPPEYDYVVTTYDAFKSGTKDYEGGNKKDRKFPKGHSAGATAINGQIKRDAMEALAANSYVIMDESHNAGGEDSNVSKYLQYITTRTKGTTFLSATFAKRPGNMPIYALKTAISEAGVKIDELIDAVKRGGATFQEVMSKALTEAGEMIRRERDMTGVTIDWRGIEDEAVIEKQRKQYDEVIGLFNDIINFQKTYVDPIVDQLNDDAAESQGEVEHTPGTRDMGINNTPFASRTYNMVQQMLLSLKAEEAAKRAIEHLKLGRKPVITVANTNEKASEEAGGMDEDMVMPDLSVNLKKGLENTMRITSKDANGDRANSSINFSKLSPEGQARYKEIMDKIDATSSGLSLSPIDVIKNELKKAGYRVGELTGRTAEFIYNPDGTVKRVKREDTDKKKVAAKFNNGELDALILNKSAGTGISLHASSKFKDQRPRMMIVAQAQGDVNDEVQIRGRIDRTGQVHRGMYEYVVSQIPSEQRLLMMLKSKLRSLDANTTSSQKSKFNEMEVQDVMNKYGDDILVQYLAEHPNTYAKMADPLGWGDTVFDTDPEELAKNVTKKEEGATASKILGRMALLSVKEQEAMLDEIGELYSAEINRLNEMGENDLEITEMPLKAKTLNKNVWEEGVDPNGGNPFADNTYVEKVEMDVLKKPMKGSEVKGAQDALTEGKSWDDYKADKMAQLDAWEKEKVDAATADITARAEKQAADAKEKYQKGALKAKDKNGMTEEEIAKNADLQYKYKYDEVMQKLDAQKDAIAKQKRVFVNALDSFSTDGVYVIPENIYDINQIGFGEKHYGKLIDVKITSNYSPNASTLTFATLDGRRKVIIPINGMVKQIKGEKQNAFVKIATETAHVKNGFYGANEKNKMSVLGQNAENWDRLTSTASRKEGYIITGNLLKALVSTRDQGVGGKLISYTTDKGEIKQGLLMSDNFEPKGLTSKTPISSKFEDLTRNRNDITSADGQVEVKHDYRDWYELRVPKSTKAGGKYFNDEELQKLVYNQFHTKAGKMCASIEGKENLEKVLKRLDKLGVTVADEVKEDEGTRFSEDLAGSTITGWGKAVPNELKMDEGELTDRIMQTSGDSITRLLDKVSEDKSNVVNWCTHVNGNYYFYTVDSDYGIRINDAVRATKDNYDTFKLLYGRYEIGRSEEALRSDMQKAGYTVRASGDMFGRFIAGELGRDSGLDNRNGEPTTSSNRGLRIDAENLSSSARSTWQQLSTGFLRALERGDYVTADRVKEIMQEQYGHLNAKGEELAGGKDDICPPFKNNRGNTISRGGTIGGVKHKIGKVMMGKLYIHKDYAKRELPKGLLEKAEKYLPDGFHYNTICWDPKKPNVIRFDECPNFDTVRNPRVGKQFGVDVETGEPIYKTKDGSGIRNEQQIFHDKWEWVDNDYIAFSVRGSYNWSKEYNSKIEGTPNGRTNKWEEQLENAGLKGKDDVIRYKTSEELDKEYPGWQNQTNPKGANEGGHSTQISSTRKTYQKVGKWMLDNGMKDAAVLDASSGLGFGTLDMREMGLNVEDVEPFAGKGRQEPPTYTSYDEIDKQYDLVVSNAVLNVIPDDWRADVLKSMADKVKVGGKMFINCLNAVSLGKNTKILGTRANGKPNEVLTMWDAEHYRSYQHIYSAKELADYVKEQLGDGWKVETAKKAGIDSSDAIVVTRETDDVPRYRDVPEEVWKNMPSGKAEGTVARSEIRKHVESVVKDLGEAGKGITMHDDISTVTNAKARKALEQGRKVAGWWDSKTNSVHLYMPNIHSRYEAEKTIVHETIGHKGMRGLLGDAGYRKYMDMLWADKSLTELRDFVKKNMPRMKWDMYEAIDEWIAREAEKTVTPEKLSMWGKIRSAFERAIREIGYRWNPNISDVRYALWLAKRGGKNPDDPWFKARAAAMRDKLSKEDYSPAVKDGMYVTNDKIVGNGGEKAQGALARASETRASEELDDDNADIMGMGVRAHYDDVLQGNSFKRREANIDNMESLNVLQRLILKGKEAKDSVNAYLAENHITSIAEAQWNKFRVQKFKPLEDAVNQCVGLIGGRAKRVLDKVDQYVYMKHGLERNRRMFVKKALDKYAKSEEGIEAEKNYKYMQDNSLSPADMADMEKSIETADSKWSKFNDAEASAYRDYKAGKIGYGEYLGELDEAIREFVDGEYDSSKVDYSGVSAFDDSRKYDGKNVEYNEQAIIDAVDEMEGKLGKENVDNIWSKIKEATDYGVDYAYESGQADKDGAESIKSMYHFYVPLRGFAEDKMEDIYEGRYNGGTSTSNVGKILKKAFGRKSLADSPLATISAMANSAILQGERNKMLQKFYRLVVKNPNDAVKVSETWEIAKDAGKPTETWEIAMPEIPLEADGTETTDGKAIADAVDTFNKRMKELEAKGEARKVIGRPKYPAGFKNKLNASQHAVRVYINGREKWMWVCGDPRAAQALRGEIVHKTSKYNYWAKGMHKMAGLVTSYSPEFIESNFSRDTLFSQANIASKESAAYLGKFMLNQARCAAMMGFSGIGGDYHFKEGEKIGIGKLSYTVKGEHDFGRESCFDRYYRGEKARNRMEQEFFDFMDNGGRTGFIAQMKVEDAKAKLATEIKGDAVGSKAWSSIKTIAGSVPKAIEEMNMRAELVNRFATYLTSRDMGRSKMRSVADAKEVSVNFNRHGAGNATEGGWGVFAGAMRNYFMFYNAGMQSMNLLDKNLYKEGTHGVSRLNPMNLNGKTAGYSALYMGALPMLAGFGLALAMTNSDDEEYSNIPSWDRRNNMCFPVKGVGYVKIPLPIELRAFWGMGDIIASIDKPRLQTDESVAFAMAGQISQMMPLDMLEAGQKRFEGDTWWIPWLPTMMRPLAENMMNVDWTGKPIQKDSKYFEDAPQWTLAYKSLPGFEVELCKWVHDKTREGNETAQETDVTGVDISPAKVDHLVKSYLGGIYSMIFKMVGAATAEKKDPAHFPMVSRLWGSFTDRELDATTNAKYWSYKREYDNTHKEYTNKANKTNPTAMTELGNSARGKRHNQFGTAEKEIKRLQKQADAETDNAAKLMLTNLIAEKKKALVDAMDKIE